MYAWIWKKLPGKRFTKTLQAVILVASVMAALWLFVYPYVQYLLTVDPSVNSD
jgi:hypothetical protein